MTIYFATDHAGFELKNELLAYVRDELGFSVEDCGAHELDPVDDYPTIVEKAARAVAEDPDARKAIVLGGSGQGEAMVANRVQGIRAAVYYGGNQDIIRLSREHNDANILSLGARFVSSEEARSVVALWLETAFSGEERHARRISMFN